MATHHRFEIYDEAHAERVSDHDSLAAALAELERLARLPWDEEPNRAPCLSWSTCGRRYELIEYDTSNNPVRRIRHLPAVEVSARGAVWDPGFPRAINRRAGA